METYEHILIYDIHAARFNPMALVLHVHLSATFSVNGTSILGLGNPNASCARSVRLQSGLGSNSWDTENSRARLDPTFLRRLCGPRRRPQKIWNQNQNHCCVNWCQLLPPASSASAFFYLVTSLHFWVEFFFHRFFWHHFSVSNGSKFLSNHDINEYINEYIYISGNLKLKLPTSGQNWFLWRFG